MKRKERSKRTQDLTAEMTQKGLNGLISIKVLPITSLSKFCNSYPEKQQSKHTKICIVIQKMLSRVIVFCNKVNVTKNTPLAESSASKSAQCIFIEIVRSHSAEMQLSI